MVTNMTAETMRARAAAVPASFRGSRRRNVRDGLLGLHGEGQGLAVVRLGGVPEDHLPQVGAPVLDLLAVARHDGGRSPSPHDASGAASAAALPSSRASA